MPKTDSGLATGDRLSYSLLCRPRSPGLSWLPADQPEHPPHLGGPYGICGGGGATGCWAATAVKAESARPDAGRALTGEFLGCLLFIVFGAGTVPVTDGLLARSSRQRVCSRLHWPMG